MNWLIISTLPHYLALIPLYLNQGSSGLYAAVVATSSTASIVYHMDNESNRLITCVDYGLAGAWFACELILGGVDVQIIFLNLIVFLWNVSIGSENYVRQHSVWHLVSAAKATYISYLINSDSDPKGGVIDN